MKRKRGFTLIELVIVIAIIGILVSIAIPAYQDYLTRSKWSKVVSTLESIKVALAECLNDNAVNPEKCDGFEGIKDYGITALPSLKDGATTLGVISMPTTGLSNVVVSGNEPLAGCSFTFTPALQVSGGVINWVSSTSEPCVKYVKGSTAN